MRARLRVVAGTTSRVAAAGLVATLVTLSATAADAAAADAPVGAVRITTPSGGSLAGGGSNTKFAVALPGGAKCAGDTAHDGYLVSSFLVPHGQSPVTVSFRTGVPSDGFGIISDGAYWGAINTALDTGQIVNLPGNAEWARLRRRDVLPTGTDARVWDVGIACADGTGAVTAYWSAPIRFRVSDSDPRGFTWTVGKGAATESSSGLNSTGSALTWIVVTLGLAGLLVYFVGRSATRRPAPTGTRS